MYKGFYGDAMLVFLLRGANMATGKTKYIKYLEIYNASFVSWDPVLRVIYLTNWTGQKWYMTALK